MVVASKQEVSVMKSIWYRITGMPRNCDDCLAYAAEHELSAVSLELELHESFRDAYLVDRCMASLTWRFLDKTVRCEMLLAGCLVRTGIDKDTVDKANHRLEELLDQLSSLNVPVSGSTKRFDCTGRGDAVKTLSWI